MDAFTLAVAENANDARSVLYKIFRGKTLMPAVVARLMFSKVLRRALSTECGSTIVLFMSLLRAEWLLTEKTDAQVEQFLLKNTEIQTLRPSATPRRKIRVCIVLDQRGQHYLEETIILMYKQKSRKK
jgi:hypothetical protein